MYICLYWFILVRIGLYCFIFVYIGFYWFIIFQFWFISVYITNQYKPIQTNSGVNLTFHDNVYNLSTPSVGSKYVPCLRAQGSLTNASTPHRVLAQGDSKCLFVACGEGHRGMDSPLCRLLLGIRRFHLGALGW